MYMYSNNLMSLHIESDSCDHSGVGILLTLLSTKFFHMVTEKKFSRQLVPPTFGP